MLSSQERINAALFEKLMHPDSDEAKVAVDAINDFTRTKMREDGFYRRIMPPVPVATTAISIPPVQIGPSNIPFEKLPENIYIRGPRYKVDVGNAVIRDT